MPQRKLFKVQMLTNHVMWDLTKSTFYKFTIYFYFKIFYKSLKIARKDCNM